MHSKYYQSFFLVIMCRTKGGFSRNEVCFSDPECAVRTKRSKDKSILLFQPEKHRPKLSSPLEDNKFKSAWET